MYVKTYAWNTPVCVLCNICLPRSQHSRSICVQPTAPSKNRLLMTLLLRWNFTQILYMQQHARGHLCFTSCCLLLYDVFSEMAPDVVTQVLKTYCEVITMCLPFKSILHCSAPNQNKRLYLPPGLLLTGLGQVWFRLKKIAQKAYCVSCASAMTNASLPLLPSKKSVSVEQLLWPLLSADWQVQRLVTGAVGLRRGQWRGERAGQDLRELPGQPPLNEFVHGMRPDNGYITHGERCGRGSRPGRHVERLFFPVALNLFISSVFHLPSGTLANRGTP